MSYSIENGKLFGVYSVDNLEKQLTIWTKHLNVAVDTVAKSQQSDFYIRTAYGDEAANNWTEKAKRDTIHYQSLVNKVNEQLNFLKGNINGN